MEIPTEIASATLIIRDKSGQVQTLRTTEAAHTELNAEASSDAFTLSLVISRARADIRSGLWTLTVSQSMARAVRESRPDCPATVHDSRNAYQKHGCRCPRARGAESAARSAYYRRNRERLREKAREARRRWRAENPPLDPNGGAPTYTDPRELSDRVMVDRILHGGDIRAATRYDYWHATLILLKRKDKSQKDIAQHVGRSVAFVQRINKFFRENGLLDGRSAPSA